jgi:hypothetical protein
MTFYDLSHLVQPDTQNVIDPIQDDEALCLDSIIKGMPSAVTQNRPMKVT